jgi:hypothetical protein
VATWNFLFILKYQLLKIEDAKNQFSVYSNISANLEVFPKTSKDSGSRLQKHHGAHGTSR